MNGAESGSADGAIRAALGHLAAAAGQVAFFALSARALPAGSFVVAQAALAPAFVLLLPAYAWRARNAARPGTAPSGAGTFAVALGAAAVLGALFGAIAARGSAPLSASAFALGALAAAGLATHHAHLGRLLGLGAEKRFAALLAFEPALRCLLALLLLRAAPLDPLRSLLGAFAASTLLSAALGGRSAPTRRPGPPLPATTLSRPAAMAALLALGLLAALECSLAPAVLGVEEAARVSAASVAARPILLLAFPSALLVALGAQPPNPPPSSWSRLRRYALPTAAAGVVIGLLAPPIGAPLLEALLGPPYAALGARLQLRTVGGAALALSLLLLAYGTARGRVSLALLPLLSAGLFAARYRATAADVEPGWLYVAACLLTAATLLVVAWGPDALAVWARRRALRSRR